MSSVSDENRIRTNFLENQAKEVSHKERGKAPLIAFGIVALGAVSFGCYQAVNFLLNYQSIAMLKSIELILDKPTTTDGKATVDVVVRNNNPFAVKQFQFAYTIDGVDGGTVSSGTVTLPTAVPGADERKFANVSLGAITGEPAKMHVDLSKAVIAEKTSLPGDVQNRVTDALYLKEQDSFAALEALNKEVPKNATILTALGLAYEECQYQDKAKVAYEEAIAVDPQDENAHYHLALLLTKSDPKKAKAELETAAQIAPEDPGVKEAIAKLGAK